MTLDENQQSFIRNLLRLAREAEEGRGEGRAALANLRSGLGKEPGKMARVHKYVDEYLPERICDERVRWYYVTATLFGLYPKHRSRYSLGKAFRPLRQKSDSMEARFIALLNAHPDDLDDYLRHAISLLKANEQPLDWFWLLEDLLQWDYPEGHVQLKWARDFYRKAGETGSRIDTKDNETIEQEEK